MTTVLITPKLK